jgi:glyoxylase-like metal-dependent hydrolase (beta-lactamase superfamily II)
MIAGVPVAVAGGSVPVHCLLARNAGPMTGPGTNSYLVGEQRLAVVDPGPVDPQHLQAILDFAGERPINWIFVTHTHGDHSPGAAPLQARTGAQVIGLPPPPGSGQDPSFCATRPFYDGECIHCDGFSMRLIHTPGHVSNHLCFLLEQDGLLFTGDHILDGMTPVIAPPDGCMRQYLRSLESLGSLPLQALAPAHGRMMHEPLHVIETLLRHRARRESKLLGVLVAQRQPLSLQALASLVYDDIAPALLPLACRTLLAHLLKLEAEGRAWQVDALWQGVAHGR